MKVFLDIDDALNSLTMHFLRLRGCNVGDYEYDKFPSECGYDIIGAYSKLSGKPTMDVKSFWEYYTRDVWETIPLSPQFQMILDFAEQFGQKNVCLLSSTTKGPDQLAGKLKWVQTYLPSWLHRQYLFGPRKWFCAGPDTVLVDDSDDNVNSFRQWGGHAILVPRPWNTNRGKDTSSYLKRAFAQFPVTL